MYTFSPMMVANSRKHHCRVRPYTREVLVLSTNLEIQTKHYSLVFRNRRGDEARIKKTWYNQVRIADYISTFKLFGLLYQPQTVFGLPPYPFNYPIRMLTMEEILAKIIDEGKRKHEEMEIFIKEFRTTNELLLKERINGVTTRGGKMTSEVAPSKEINETRINKNEPPRLQEACTETMNERCSALLLNELPLKEKYPRSFIIPCQVLKKHKESEDLAADHLSRFENPYMKMLFEREIPNKFYDEHLMVLKSKYNNDEPLYVDFINYIAGKVVPSNWTFEKSKRFFLQVKTYFWVEPYAFKLCADNITRRYVAGCETLEILAHFHSGPTGGHHSALVTEKKVYESGFYWPSVFKDANEYVSRCDACQRSGNISSRNEMPQNNILLFARFRVPKGLISDKGTHFCNSQLEKALQRYGVTYKLSMAYHPQSNGQTEVTNKAIKRILERSVGYNPKDFRLIQLNELAELRDGAYENTRIYKERTKKWHDSRLCGDKDFKVGDKVVLYNSRLKMYPGKLKSKWSRPNIVKTVYLHGAIEITDRDEFSFKVNGQRLKKYYRGNINKENDEVIEFENGVT
ncbi:reverse transcriptase domain-containing protein [Tanacetum coccineum]|uniref:Reverse transcriptase domain-containing protein n=1 Tax=Tanacetum coccineum TaxID=301880 RepID=A0ABQ5CUN1_9ASTR